MSNHLVHIPELAVRLAYNGYDFSKKDLGSIVDDIMRSNRRAGRCVSTYVWVSSLEEGPYRQKQINIPYL